MLLLGEQENLFARVDQAPDRQHTIIFADIWIEENRVTPRVNHFSPPRLGVARRDAIKHPLRWSYHGIRAHQSIEHGTAIPIQCAPRLLGTILHRLPPGKQIAMRHNDLWNVDREVAVTKLVEMQNIGTKFLDQGQQER